MSTNVATVTIWDTSVGMSLDRRTMMPCRCLWPYEKSSKFQRNICGNHAQYLFIYFDTEQSAAAGMLRKKNYTHTLQQ